MGQRGSTLIELILAAAISILIAAVFFTLAQGSRAFAMRSASAQFDAALSYAQALAATSGDGATLVFDKRRAADGTVAPGFVLTVYSGRPAASGALHRAPMPPVQSTGDVTEAKLGGVPFAVFLNGAGHASASSGTVAASTVIASDPGCPAGESSVVLRFGGPAASDVRKIPCSLAAAGIPAVLRTPSEGEKGGPCCQGLLGPVRYNWGNRRRRWWRLSGPLGA